MGDTEQKTRRAIPLQAIIVLMVSIGFLISVILLNFMYQTSISYSKTRESTMKYNECQNIAAGLLAGSDTLTAYARGFVVTGDPQQAELYFGDTQAQNAISEAIEEVRELSGDERVLSQLDSAMHLREQLMSLEVYAMRLKVAAIGGDISEYPEELRDIQLLPADLALSPGDKDNKARSILFDIDYESSKNEISLRINKSMDVLIRNMLEKQAENGEHMTKVLRRQQGLTAALMCTLLAFALIVLLMVVAPLRRQISRMSNDQMLVEEGTSELRFLARTYNRLHEQNRVAADRLNYEATHDGLTGLYNRAAYESMLEDMIKAGGALALILLDVDIFKHINDERGHDVGDAVLKSVADNLRGAFRRDDMVCRIGGDEFAVIMSKVDSGFRDQVRDKLKRVAGKLATPVDGLPGVTISAGVAFADELIPNTDLFKSADLALYKVKNGGRNGCGFSFASGEIETVSDLSGAAVEK